MALMTRRAALSGAAAIAFLAPLRVNAQQGPAARFVYADLVSDQPTVARDFYRELFSWRFANSDGTPTEQVISRRGREVGRLVESADLENRVEGQWVPVLSVSSTRETFDSARVAGARSVTAPALAQDGGGTFAVIRDPGGALITLYDGPVPAPAVRRPGQWAWIDLLTSGIGGAQRFYNRAVGFTTVDAEGAPPQFLFLSNGFPVGGIVTVPRGRVRPTWLPYVGVSDLAATLSEAERLKGQVIARNARSAVVVDPTGVGIGVQQL